MLSQVAQFAVLVWAMDSMGAFADADVPEYMSGKFTALRCKKYPQTVK